MWCIKKFGCFQVYLFVIFFWMVLDLTNAAQDENADTVAVPIVNTNIDIDADSDGVESDMQLSGQLFEFAQFFTTECLKFEPGNVIISPLSVSIALNLLLQATNGSTFDELRTGLHLRGDKVTLAHEFPEYLRLLHNNVGCNSTLSIANQIYVQNHYQLNATFKTVIAQQFQSNIETVNFADSETSAATINHFVEEKTNGKIKKFIAPDHLDATTRAIIVNAVHFKGQWQQQFDKTKTIRGDFYTNETKTVPVEFMTAKEYFHTANLIALNARALELKYANSNYSFMIILPDNRTGLADLESKLKYVNLADVASQMSLDEIEITIPKFTIEYEIKLNDVLKNLGITKVFTPDADLSGLLESNDPLYVSNVIHKAFIEVNEEGSEASAATGIGAVYYSLNFEPEFRADHPFVYYIRETETNTIVFSGRYQKPN